MGFLDKLFGGGKKQDAPSGVSFQYNSGPGDTCRSLAKRFYGDESQWERVYNPNKHLLKDEVQSGSDQLLIGTGLTIKDPKFDLTGQPAGSSS